MTRLRASGYLFMEWDHDHSPRHVHVFRDSKLVAKYDYENQRFMALADKKHQGRILRALKTAGYRS